MSEKTEKADKTDRTIRADAGKEKLSSAFDESGLVCRTHVGGQALIEGIMMRGRYNWALAVRKPDGSIYVEEHDLASGKDKNSWMYKPVVRGCTAMAESLALGYKALEIAANHAYEEYEEPEPPEASGASALPDASAAPHTAIASGDAALSDAPASHEIRSAASAGEVILAEAAQEGKAEEEEAAEEAVEEAEEATRELAREEARDEEAALPKSVMTISMIVGVLLGVAIFIIVPAVVTNLLVGDYGEKTLVWNLVDGVLRVAIFVGYIFLIGLMPDIKRMFGYHGAEHRTIHCYERGKDLTVANAQSYPSLHVRCGTAFMLMTMIIAILVFTLVPINWLIDGLGIQNEVLRLIVVILSRIILIPLIAGLSYELTVKWAGSHPDNLLVRIILWPGLQLQRLTTKPPDDGMVECAIAAMKAVLAREQLEVEKAAQ